MGLADGDNPTSSNVLPPPVPGIFTSVLSEPIHEGKDIMWPGELAEPPLPRETHL